MLKGHGDDIYSHNKKIVSNFSSNVYNKLDLKQLRQHLADHLQLIHSYPEPTGDSLIAMLAHHAEIAPQNIVLTNGATEAIYTIAQAFSKTKSAIIIPTFSEYEDACTIHQIDIQYTDCMHTIDDDVKLLWLCNPNNPTGKSTSKTDLLTFADTHPHITMVIDQSYQYFTNSEMLAANDVVNRKNIILLQSMTKQYAIPGLRLGYALSHSSLIDRLSIYKMPWSVNALAIEAGKYLLQNDLSSQLDMASYLQETERFRNELSIIKGLEIYPTQTHFFLCKLTNSSALELKNYLVAEHGILIRDAANFRGLTPHHFRLATQTKKENNKLIEAIKAWEIYC